MALDWAWFIFGGPTRTPREIDATRRPSAKIEASLRPLEAAEESENRLMEEASAFLDEHRSEIAQALTSRPPGCPEEQIEDADDSEG